MPIASASGLPAVSLIVPTRNRPEMISRLVASVLDGELQPDEFLIIDQSDHEHPRRNDFGQRNECSIRYIRPGTIGLSRANNAGARLATHEVLVFTHDDVLVERDWLRALVSAHVDFGDRVIVTGRVASTEPESPGAFAPALRDDLQPASYEGRLGFDVLKPMNVVMTKTTLFRVGGFDERLGPGTPFPGAEDADLGFRLLEAGFRIEYFPGALVRHRAWRSDADYMPLRWSYGIALGAFYAKHFRWRDPHVIGRAARDVGRRVRGMPRRWRHEGGRAFGDVVFIAGTVVGSLKWARRPRAPERGTDAVGRDPRTRSLSSERT